MSGFTLNVKKISDNQYETYNIDPEKSLFVKSAENAKFAKKPLLLIIED